MKTILLIGISMLHLLSCGDASDFESIEIPSDEEMKTSLEVEEANIEIDSIPSDLIATNESKIKKEKFIDPSIGGCVIPKSELRGDLLPELREPKFEPAPDSIEEVVEFPDVDAQYPGGVEEMRKFIVSNLEYPLVDGGFEYQGVVYVSMIIERDGSIRDATVLREGIAELNAEALRLIRSMPNWIPAQNNGKVVAAKV
ncbi:MAG: energy transducer TonB [Crocinitomicaceae bacterium]|nr:energy transducer TonB [Crocinitomicaceae bacterium]